MSGIKIYLDDLRPTPDGWVRAYWPEDVYRLLETNEVDIVSLDHDLGDDERGTGYDVVTYIEEKVVNDGYEPPTIRVHSANTSARIKMLNGIDQINKLANKKYNLSSFNDNWTDAEVLEMFDRAIAASKS